MRKGYESERKRTCVCVCGDLDPKCTNKNELRTFAESKCALAEVGGDVNNVRN